MELIQNALAEHEEYASFQTNNWNELCEFLGFVPSIVDPSVLEASTVLYIAHIDPGLIIVDALYKDVSQNTVAVFKQEYYIDIEEAYLVIQQDAEGNYIDIGGHQVYSNANMGHQSLSWISSSTLTHLSGTFDITVGVHIVEQLIGGSQNE